MVDGALLVIDVLVGFVAKVHFRLSFKDELL